MSQWIKITEIENVPVMGSRIIIIDDNELVIFKTKDNCIFALNNQIMLKDGKTSEKLSEGLVHEHMVTCIIYAWDIDLETGMVQGEDNISAKIYDTKVEEGFIYLSL
jgi:nitrite reductase (NADH) small subunit